jgi:phenylalanyl-tRNA synthetase beta chain
VQVVCGAPNARTGLVGVFAPPARMCPGTGVDLKPGVIRGVESNGMLCSEREMMLSDDHDGIIDLPADAPLGTRFIDWRGPE